MSNDDELMAELRNIVDAEGERLDGLAHQEAETITRKIFEEIDKEFADNSNSVLLYVAEVTKEEALKDFDSKKHVVPLELEGQDFHKSLKDDEARAAKAALACPPIPKSKLLEILDSQEPVMLLHGWSNLYGLIVRVVHDDGSVFKAASFPSDLAFEFTLPDGTKSYSHHTYEQDIPEPQEFGGQENMDIMRLVCSAAQSPRELKRNFPDAFDALIAKITNDMKNKMKDMGLDTDDLD